MTTLHNRSRPTLLGSTSCSFIITRRCRLVLLAGYVTMLLCAPLPAVADVCGMSASGSEPQDWGGSTAAGSYAVACGLLNTTNGDFSTAMGDNNTASSD